MLDAPPAILYHYTCRDRLPGITADRVLDPNRHPALGRALVWLTDLDVPDRRALGLTSDYLICDRTAIRVTVMNTPAIQRWPVWARRAQVSARTRALLEADAFPMHWWVSPQPVDVHTIESRAETVAS